MSKALQQLGDEDFAVREAAGERLFALGEQAREALEGVAENSKDMECRSRSQQILDRLDHVDEAKAQRTLDEKAYAESFLPRKECLFRQHAGKWIAIAGGKILPSTTEGVLAPAASLEEAEAVAEKACPQARHRFVFRIGEEGDLRYDLGGTEWPESLGSGFLVCLQRDWMIRGTDEMWCVVGEKQVQINVPRPGGKTGLDLLPELRPPGGDRKRAARFAVATGFDGIAVMRPRIARALALARWEIPGSIQLEGVCAGTCRRARVRFRLPQIGWEETLPVAVWEE